MNATLIFTNDYQYYGSRSLSHSSERLVVTCRSVGRARSNHYWNCSRTADNSVAATASGYEYSGISFAESHTWA